MLYCDNVTLTGSTTTNTDGTSATLTLNSFAKRLLYIGAINVDATLTAAEGRQSVIALLGGPGVDNAPLRIPAGLFVGAGLAPEDSANSGPVFYPIDIPSSPNAVYTFAHRGLGSTVAELMNVFVIYSDGEGHGANWSMHGLRAVPKYYQSPDSTSITATTETALTAITVPGNARECVGLGVASVTNGVKTTAEEFSARVRWTATGSRVAFEPAQIWPVEGALSAGLGAIIDSTPYIFQFSPLRFGVVPNSTITGNVTLRTAVTNATAFRAFAAFI